MYEKIKEKTLSLIEISVNWTNLMRDLEELKTKHSTNHTQNYTLILKGQQIRKNTHTKNEKCPTSTRELAFLVT